ncbi:phosphatase inhibitor-domain-containing protein [Peziza echinospora]|nr:phosphatase inhibitor-domain-containing protein [Peziza echinospora]
MPSILSNSSTSGQTLHLGSNRPSRTQVVSASSDEDERTPSPPRIPDGTLRLRGGPISDRRVTWGEDVIDNEGLGRKKSKVCCIFHRAREFGESSDESSSDSSDDSDNDDGRARPVGGKKAGGCGNGKHDHKRRGPKRPSSPNAYEKMPKAQRKKE